MYFSPFTFFVSVVLFSLLPPHSNENGVCFDGSGDFYFFLVFLRRVFVMLLDTNLGENKTWPGIMCPHCKRFLICQRLLVDRDFVLVSLQIA